MKTKKRDISQDRFLNEISKVLRRSQLDSMTLELESILEQRVQVYNDISNSAFGRANPEQARLLKDLDAKEGRLTQKKEALELEQYAESKLSPVKEKLDRSDRVSQNNDDPSKIREKQKGRDEERER